MRSLLFLALISFAIPTFAQKRLDSLECGKINIAEFREDFINNPSCASYTKLKRYHICKHLPFEDLRVTYVAAFGVNCIQAYHDLYSFYQELNYNLSKKTPCDDNTLLLNNLDNDTRNLAIKALVKSEIAKDDLAAYYYYGVYIKKDRKKAISLIRESYTYEVSDKKIIEELDNMKSSFVSCSK